MAKYSVFFAHVNDLAREKNISFDEAAAFVKNLGYEAFDCEYAYIKNNFDFYKGILDKFGFKTAAIPCFFHFDKGINTEIIDDVLYISSKLDCKTILAIPGEFTTPEYFSGEFAPDDVNKENYLNLMCEGLSLLCEKAEKFGITVTLEDFDSEYSPCATEKGLSYFFEKVPALKFNMDTGNFIYMDLDTLECVKLFKNKISHVHLKDRSLVKNYADEPEKVTPGGNKLFPSPVGFGTIPMKELTDLAKANGYEGYYSAENSCPIHMEEFLTKSIEWMKENI